MRETVEERDTASKLRRRRATEDMHACTSAAKLDPPSLPLRLFPTGLHSLLTSSLVMLLLLVGARGKKSEMGRVGGCVRHVLVCVVGCVWW